MDVVGALQGSDDLDRTVCFGDRDRSLRLDVELFLQTDFERPFDHLDILDILQILDNLAFQDFDRAENLGGFLERINGWQDLKLDPDMACGLLQHGPIGSGQQQNRFLTMPDLAAFRSQDRLVVSNQVDDVFAWDVVGGNNNHPLPVKGGIERNGPDASPGHGRSDRPSVPGARGDDVVRVTRAPRHFVDALAAGDGAADGWSERRRGGGKPSRGCWQQKSPRRLPQRSCTAAADPPHQYMPIMTAAPTKSGAGLAVHAGLEPGSAEILTAGARRFLTTLARACEGRRQELLARRVERQRHLEAGELPDFLPETRSVREAAWTVAPIPADLTDRRVEITGPVDRKMIINALNSGARVYMADFEDSNAPTWRNNLEGQSNLRDAVRGTIGFTSPEGKRYALGSRTATLMVRPRGWHLDEKHVTVDGRPISAALFDFGLFFFHNAAALIAKGTGPYF